MSLRPVAAGFMPLVDAGPLVVAKELGFAEEEGLNLILERAPSWSTLRDMLAFGQIQAAHMLSPVPIASHLGLLRGLPQFQTLSILGINGNVIGVSAKIAALMTSAGFGFDFQDARVAGAALRNIPKPLRVGVPFHLSMHAELVLLWLQAVGLEKGSDFQIQAVPPPLMAQAMRNGDIDIFCVGEPWGSVTVEVADGRLLLPCSAIWSASPEKVLATRADWLNDHKDFAKRLIRALWRAGKWAASPDKQTALSELLARPEYVGVEAQVIDRALTGELVINRSGVRRRASGFLNFHEGAAGFPWQSQSAWIANRLIERFALTANPQTVAQAATRSDLYRAALIGTGAALPLTSSKIEGGLQDSTEARAVNGSLVLAQNCFFDGQIFDPGV